MATFAGLYKCRVKKMLDGSIPPVQTFYEASSQTWVVGDLVYRSSGYVTICGADPSQILGIAKAAGANGTQGTITTEVNIITADTLIEMQVHHTTPANAVIEAADHGKLYGIAVGTGSSAGVWYVDKNETSNTRVRVVEFVDALATANGKVLVQVLAANREYA